MRILVGVVLSAAAGCASVATCGDCVDQSVPDLSAPGGDLAVPDLAVPADLAVKHDLQSTDLSKIYMPAAIHDIDVGTVPQGTLVLLQGVVLTTTVRGRPTQQGMCSYQAWVQDPAGAAPSGIGLFAVVPPSSDGGTPSCAPVPSSGSPFDGHPRGENLDVRGRVFVQAFAADGGATLTEHSIAVDFLTPNGGAATVAATPVSTPASFAGYGAGFAAYEGMVVELTCGAARCAVTQQPSPYLWSVTGGALFGSEFAGDWPGKPGPNGTSYSKLVGVANTFLTGSLEPRDPADFVP